MPATTLSRGGRPALRRALLSLALTLLVLSPLVLALLAVETAPRVERPGPPDAAAAALTRELADGLEELVASEGAGDTWSADEDQLNAVLAAAQRLAPGVRGVARVEETALTVELSVGAPIMPLGLWANLELAVAPSDGGLSLASARIGRLPVPPALALRGIRMVLNRKLGAGLGIDALASIDGVRLDPPRVAVAFDFDRVGREAFFDRLRERALAAAGTTAREQVYVQLWHLDKAVRNGALPRGGSMLPYLERVVRIAARQRSGADREELRAALYTLALYCGDPEFGTRIGVALEERLQGAGNGCEGTTLAERDDLKRHFAVSAGLYAAAAGGAAFGIGELKELFDSNAGGSGFSFADMAADAAGVRFAKTFLAAPRGDWRPMLARIGGEADLMPALDGLPEGLSEAEFRRRYRDVDSPEYAAIIAEISRRLDALPLYREGAAD